MAFCTSCGAASEATAAFCPSCGTKALHAPAQATTAPTPVPPAPMAQPVAVAKAGAPWMKILVVVGVLFVGGLAALVYGAYWVKNKVVSTAAVHGITWPSGDKANSSGGPFSGGSASKSKHGQLIDACSLISQEDADAVLGEPSTRSEHQADDAYSSHCHYSVAEATHATNGFGVEIHNNEDASEARTGQTLSKGIYSNFAIYNYQDSAASVMAAFLRSASLPETWSPVLWLAWSHGNRS